MTDGYLGYDPLITTDGKKRVAFHLGDVPMMTAGRFGKRSGNDETAEEGNRIERPLTPRALKERKKLIRA